MRYSIMQAALVCSVLNIASASAIPAAPVFEMASSHANMPRSEQPPPLITEMEQRLVDKRQCQSGLEPGSVDERKCQSGPETPPSGSAETHHGSIVRSPEDDSSELDTGETDDAGEPVAYEADDETPHAEHAWVSKLKTKRHLTRDCVRQPHHKHCVEEITNIQKAKREIEHKDPCEKHPNGKKCQKQQEKEANDGDDDIIERSDSEAEVEYFGNKAKRDQHKDPCIKHPDSKKCLDKQWKEGKESDNYENDPPMNAAVASDVEVEAKSKRDDNKKRDEERRDDASASESDIAPGKDRKRSNKKRNDEKREDASASESDMAYGKDRKRSNNKKRNDEKRDDASASESDMALGKDRERNNNNKRDEEKRDDASASDSE